MLQTSKLLFIYGGNGKTTGPNVITTAEFYEKVVQSFISSIEAKREGIFEIDLRLRPYGRSGSMAVSLAGFRRYFMPEGPAWAFERQALVKLRPVAGNERSGHRDLSGCGTPMIIAVHHLMSQRCARCVNGNCAIWWLGERLMPNTVPEGWSILSTWSRHYRLHMDMNSQTCEKQISVML